MVRIEKKFVEFERKGRKGVKGLKCDGKICVPALFEKIDIYTHDRQNYYTVIARDINFNYMILTFKPRHEGVERISYWIAPNSTEFTGTTWVFTHEGFIYNRVFGLYYPKGGHVR